MSQIDRRVLLACLSLIALLTLLNLHGFSLAHWHKIIDQSPESEILLGKSRWIRGDDFILDIPLSLAQLKNPGGFAITNPNIAPNSYMGLPLGAPVTTPVLIFQPSTWGYYVGGDFGIAFEWWLKVIGIFLSTYLLLRRFTLTEKTAMAASLAMSVSPFFQFWSYFMTEGLIFSNLALWSTLGLAQARSRRAVIGAGLMLGWSISCFLCNSQYPPFMITLFYATLAIFASWLLAHPGRTRDFFWRGQTWVGLAIGGVVFGVAAVLFQKYYGEPIAAISATTYPGQRVLTGGGVPFWKYFLDQVYIEYEFKRLSNWGTTLNNISEVSSFVLLFPVIFAAYCYTGIRHRYFPRSTWPIFAVIGVLVLYSVCGFPESLSRMTLLSKVSGHRTQFAVGLLNLFLLAYVFQDQRLKRYLGLPAKYALVVLHAAYLTLFVFWMKQDLPDLRIWILIPGLIAQGFLVWSLWSEGRWGRYFFVILALVTAPYSMGFNPLARGGYEYFFSNPLAQKMLSLSQQAPQSRWMVLSTTEDPEFFSRAMNLAILPRVIGVPAVGGFMCPPQPKLIQDLEMSADDQRIANECAYNTFVLDPASKTARIQRMFQGQMRYYLNTEHSIFAKYLIDYLVVVGETQNELPNFIKIDQLNGLSIWQRSKSEK